jgi:hypothetical protein
MVLQKGEVGVELVETVFDIYAPALKNGQEFVVEGVEFVGQGDITSADEVAGDG